MTLWIIQERAIMCKILSVCMVLLIWAIFIPVFSMSPSERKPVTSVNTYRGVKLTSGQTVKSFVSRQRFSEWLGRNRNITIDATFNSMFGSLTIVYKQEAKTGE